MFNFESHVKLAVISEIIYAKLFPSSTHNIRIQNDVFIFDTYSFLYSHHNLILQMEMGTKNQKYIPERERERVYLQRESIISALRANTGFSPDPIEDTAPVLATGHLCSIPSKSSSILMS